MLVAAKFGLGKDSTPPHEKGFEVPKASEQFLGLSEKGVYTCIPFWFWSFERGQHRIWGFTQHPICFFLDSRGFDSERPLSPLELAERWALAANEQRAVSSPQNWVGCGISGLQEPPKYGGYRFNPMFLGAFKELILIFYVKSPELLRFGSFGQVQDSKPGRGPVPSGDFP